MEIFANVFTKYAKKTTRYLNLYAQLEIILYDWSFFCLKIYLKQMKQGSLLILFLQLYEHKRLFS